MRVRNVVKEGHLRFEARSRIYPAMQHTSPIPSSVIFGILISLTIVANVEFNEVSKVDPQVHAQSQETSYSLPTLVDQA